MVIVFEKYSRHSTILYLRSKETQKSKYFFPSIHLHDEYWMISINDKWWIPSDRFFFLTMISISSVLLLRSKHVNVSWIMFSFSWSLFLLCHIPCSCVLYEFSTLFFQFVPFRNLSSWRVRYIRPMLACRTWIHLKTGNEKIQIIIMIQMSPIYEIIFSTRTKVV